MLQVGFLAEANGFDIVKSIKRGEREFIVVVLDLFIIIIRRFVNSEAGDAFQGLFIGLLPQTVVQFFDLWSCFEFLTRAPIKDGEATVKEL